MTNKFEKLIEQEINDFNYDGMFNSILDGEYLPTKLITVIQCVIYYMDTKGRLDPALLGMFGFYLQVLRGHDKYVKTLDMHQLLYLVWKLEQTVTKINSPRKDRDLYI